MLVLCHPSPASWPDIGLLGTSNGDLHVMVSSTKTLASTSTAGVTHPSYPPPGMPPLEAMDTPLAPTTENLLATDKDEFDSLDDLTKIKHGVATTALFDSGAEIQLVSKKFCEDNEWEIQPIENLTECSTVNGEIFGYEGFVEVNVQIPGRDFSEDHLFLVTSEISHQKEIPVVLGTYFIESLSKYLHGIDKDEFDSLDYTVKQAKFDSLDYTVKQAYLSWVEATRIREKVWL